MIRDILLALGLVLSTASQLRPTGFPIGPGEICLVLWIGLTIGDAKSLLQARITPAVQRMLIFWTLFIISLCLGSATAFVTGDTHDPNLFIHDTLAYLLVATVSILSTVELNDGPSLEHTAWLLILFSIAFLGIQLAMAWDLLTIPQAVPWYWDRLRGLSENPNQLAIFCAVLTFLALHFAEHTVGWGRRSIALLCVILSVYVGRLTRSDTYGLILVTGILLFAALKLRSWLMIPGRGIPLRRAGAGIIALALPVIAAATLLFANIIEIQALDLARTMAKGTSQETSETANIRLNSWKRAIDRGINSGMLGLGPGPHIEIPLVLVAARRDSVEPKYVEHPQVNGTPNFEAHNTFLDLFTQGGLIAILALTWLVVAAFRSAYRRNFDALTVMVWGIVVLSVFHLIIRQPLFWFAIAFVLVTEAEVHIPFTLPNRSR